MASTYEIAERVGVSAATVSRVLNNRPGISAATRSAVMREATKAGVRSRDNCSTRRIALIYAMDNPAVPLFGYDADVAAGLFRGLSEEHAQLTVLRLTDRRPTESFQDFFFRSHIDAAVLRVNDATRHAAQAIADENLPCVVASDRYTEPSIGFVGYESRTGLNGAVDHLVQLGHRSIAYVQPPPGTNHDFNERHQAFRDAITRHGLTDGSEVITAELSPDGGASAINQLRQRLTPPSAVIFATPITTLGGMRRALQLGIQIPQELSVVGFDDSQLRRSVFPAFSAVCQDSWRIGYEAARISLASLRGDLDAPIEQLILSSVFEVNESTAPPPGAS